MNKFVILVLSAGISLLIYAFAEARLLRVNSQKLCSKKVPCEFDGFTVAFITDLHNYSKTGKRIRKVVNKINSLNPDIILIGGDFNCDNSPDKEVCYREISKLKSPCYTVFGNHDYTPDDDDIKRFIKKYKIRSINNRSFWIKRNGEQIKIGGLDDYWRGYPYPESFFHDVTEKDFTILVCHNPDYFEFIDTKYVSLGLGGHHHGGQCSFFGLWAPLIRSELGVKYTGTIIDRNGAKIICSNGIGTSHIPVRFCAIPEINFITLYSEANNG